MKKRIFLGIALCVFLVGGLSAEGRTDRSFLFQFGLGAAAIQYPGELQDLVDYMEDVGIDRLVMNIDLGLGYAINNQMYGLFTYSGVGDRLEDDYGDYIQFSTVLYALGVRYYPFDTGLVLGADAGLSRVVLSSDIGLSDSTDLGPGLRLSVGYDFDSNRTGVSLLLGGNLYYLYIEEEGVSAASLYLQLLFK